MNTRRILRAAHFAATKHRDQRRRDREASPYINHPLDLAYLLSNDITEPTSESVIIAALLHDTIEDTKTSPVEIKDLFGEDVLNIVMEVTDDKSLPKAERKRLQIDHAPYLSREAKLVKLADKICNLRDMVKSPPHDWSRERIEEYFAWAKAVVDAGLRGVNSEMEAMFDGIYNEGIESSFKAPEQKNIHDIPYFLRNTSMLVQQIKELREINASDREIALALSIPEDSPLLSK